MGNTATLLTSQGHFSQIPEQTVTIASLRGSLITPIGKFIQQTEKMLEVQRAGGRSTEATEECAKVLRTLEKNIGLAASNRIAHQVNKDTTEEVSEEENYSSRSSPR